MEEALTERRIKLTLHYDGAAFHGWQIQPGERTVQAEVEAALTRLTTRPVSVIAAGRTDRGVHATGQVISAAVPEKWTAAALRRALNAVLPREIWVAAAEDAPSRFHARYDARARGYVYRIGLSEAARSPFHRRWCWPLCEPLDIALLGQCAALLHGEHSFRAFAKSGQPERGDRCTVHVARWTEWQGLGVQLHIVANRFLHHMVRYLTGSIVDVARGRRALDELESLLSGESELETSPPAPAEGLFFVKVYYSPEEMHELEAGHEVLP